MLKIHITVIMKELLLKLKLFLLTIEVEFCLWDAHFNKRKDGVSGKKPSANSLLSLLHFYAVLDAWLEEGVNLLLNLYHTFQFILTLKTE